MAFSAHHSFDIELATKYGIEEAILIHHFQHWIRVNRARGKNLRDGKCWMYQSREDISAHFPYLNKDCVRRTIEGLVDIGVLVTANYNRAKFDKTLWYAFVDEKAFKVDQDSLERMHQNSNNFYERQNCPTKGKIATRDGKIAKPIPDTKEEDTKEGADKSALYCRDSAAPFPPPEAMELSQHLLSRRKELFPKMKNPNIEEWAKHIRLMHDRDNRSWEEIRKAIDFAMEDSFWYKNILSADKLRKQYDKLYAQMKPVSNKGLNIKENKQIALSLNDYFFKEKIKNKIRLYNDCIHILDSNERISYDLPKETFLELLEKYLGVRRT